ncbi:EamA family transporter [Poseidonibacter parvus]|uniref:EamA family transporter n=1 Tax=Poseidonibacter parvus TaxID=1850254 RepID=A0A1P8KPT2_9BACT|nr:DMT family transporter [Poseidonibacter parvus]APW66555.1 EamA family transporter [Poseidonibacter parvus]
MLIKKSILPFLFILLYGSGFVFTQYGLENSSPMAFLAIRFIIAFWILLILSVVLKVSWPKNIKEFIHIAIAGSLTVGTFSIGVFLSISYGIDASLSALVIALQPILVAVLAWKFLNEERNTKIIFGFLLGFIGVFFVIAQKIDNIDLSIGILYSFLALLGLSIGNIYQKKHCLNMNLFSGGAIQTLASTILVLPFLYYEDINIVWNRDFIIALLYMSVGVSIGALSLLYIMIKNADVSKVSSIFYLVPLSAVFISYLLFDAQIDLVTILGIIIVLFAIVLINKKPKNKKGKL